MLLATRRRPRHDRNGLPRADGRTLLGRRYNELLAIFRAEIARPLSPTEDLWLERAAELAIRAEISRTKLIAGEMVDAEDGANEAMRILATLKGAAG
jgi:hypothetical protein